MEMQQGETALGYGRLENHASYYQLFISQALSFPSVNAYFTRGLTEWNEITCVKVFLPVSSLIIVTLRSVSGLRTGLLPKVS